MNWEFLKELAVCVILSSGVLVITIACYGLVKLPDIFCRSHAMGKAMTLGISLCLIALWLHIGTDEAGLKILLAVFFQFLTIPIAAHLLCFLGKVHGVKRWNSRPMDARWDSGKDKR